MVILDLAEEGHYVAVRPSGTEPKVKFYLFTFVAPEQLHLPRRSAESNGPTAERSRLTCAGTSMLHCSLGNLRGLVARGTMAGMADVMAESESFDDEEPASFAGQNR